LEFETSSNDLQTPEVIVRNVSDSALNDNPFRSNPAAPVVIGGVGGSGTRLVAKIFAQAGIFLGSDLNVEHDNLWFTLLFRRPRWFRKVTNGSEERIFTGLRLLTKTMLGGGALKAEEFSLLASAIADASLNFRAANKATRGLWPFIRARNMMRAAKTPLPESYRGWGWKEPNSHIYLPYLFKQFPAVKYIHVIRHGLDLAFSRNQVQLYNWSYLFGLDLPRSRMEVPAKSLKYWVHANQRALDLARQVEPDRFLMVNFDQLCHSPSSEIERLLTFVGAKISAEEFSSLCALPEKQTSSGRYLQNDCSSFDAADVDAVRQFGFEVQL
jgi:hypothetical protein